MDKLESDVEQEEEGMDDKDRIQHPSPEYMAWERKKRAFVMFDAPHINNICVNVASAVFPGLPEKGKHDQYHSMQLLQRCVKIYKLLKCQGCKQR